MPTVSFPLSSQREPSDCIIEEIPAEISLYPQKEKRRLLCHDAVLCFSREPNNQGLKDNEPSGWVVRENSTEVDDGSDVGIGDGSSAMLTNSSESSATLE